MLEIKEQKTLHFEEDTQPPKEITNYHKRIDDLFEDAEIEAEMEAEKKIRSKNSRMFSISMTGIALLALVYFQVNHQSTVTPVESAKATNKPETAEERLAKQVPVVEDGSSGSNIPIPQSGDELSEKIDVVLPNLETDNARQNAQLLRLIAEDTGGAYFPLADAAAEVPKRLPNRGEEFQIDQQLKTLWDREWLMWLLIGLLSVEWLTRKLLKLA